MQPKIFAHRGLVEGKIKENSIAALKNAAKKGFKAVEFDIWYFENELVVSHDKPEGEILKLEDYLKTFGNALEYWLDFKNLDKNNADKAMAEFKKISKKLKINSKNLYFAPYITDFDKALVIYKIIRKYFKSARILAVIEKIKAAEFKKYHDKLVKNKIYGTSIQYKNINADLVKIFKKVAIFAWTVNDKKTLDHLIKLKIKNLTSDKIL